MSSTIDAVVNSLNAWIWGWPLVGFVIVTGVVLTLTLGFIQFRYFFRSWKYVFKPEKSKQTENYITPFQAFLNILSASIGNGSTAGMATAIIGGGPGAAFWIFVLGFLYMAIRYAEVYLSTAFREETAPGTVRGGPMVYLKKVPGGKYLAYAYAFFLLSMTFITGNGMQCNSITVGIERILGVTRAADSISAGTVVIALLLFCLLLFIMFGGAQRIIRVSEAIVPVKVGLFFISTAIVLIYHYAGIWGALKTIVAYALTPQAMAYGAIGFSVQQAIRYGMSLSLNSTEAGLGTAGIFYGATHTKEPVESSIMSMVTSFVSSHLVGFVLMLVLVLTGVWNQPGLVSTQMTMAAYATVFGTLGDIVVAFLSVSFGLGVLVAYAYVGRECWSYLTGGRYLKLYTALYTLMAIVGALSQAQVIWNIVGIANAGLVAINLYGLLYLLPYIRKGLTAWQKVQRKNA